MKPCHTSCRQPGVLSGLLLLLLAGLLPAPAARAQAVTTTSALADTSRPATFLREVVVTGYRFPRAYYQSPQALSFVSRVQLRETVPAVIGDVLSRLPGVDMSKDSPWEQRPVLRGLSGQRVLVLMDGMPMNSARGNGPHPSLVDPSQIERVEVVRGPSSVAYGSDALGGAINIMTRQAPVPDGSRGIAGSLSTSGATGENQGGGAIELMPRMGRVAAYVSGGLRSAANFDTPDGEMANSAYRDQSGLVDLRFDPTSSSSLKTGYQFTRGWDIGIPGLSSPVANYGPGNTTQFQFKEYQRDLAHLTFDHGYQQSWLASSRVRLYWQAERRNFWSDERIDASAYPIYGINFDPASSGSEYRETVQDRFFDLKTVGAQVQATSVQTPDYRFTMGIDAARDITSGNNRRQRNYVYPSGDGPVALRVTQSLPKGTFENVGAFFQNEWYVNPNWTLSTGTRWTHYRDRTEAGLAAPPSTYFKALKVDNDALCGSIGLSYEPLKDLHLSFNVANGYRQPNAQDLFFNGPASVGTVLGDPDLKPEKSISYDLGMRYENAREALAGNLFLSTYNDLIDAIDVTPAGNPPGAPHTYQYTNIAKARIMGVEGEGEWVLVRGLKARATAAGAIGDITSREANIRLYGQDLEKSPLAGVPPFKGSFGLRWSSVGRGWLEPSMRYSWRTNRLPLPTPGVGQLTDFKKEWLVVDVMAGWNFSTGQRITLGVRNVADRRYREPLASLPSPGRSFVAGLSTPLF